MLRIIQIGNSLPLSFPVNPNAEFQPGQVAQLGVMGNTILCGVSDGTAPIGIIDDIKTRAFTAPSIDEVVIVPTVGVETDGVLVAPNDVVWYLENSPIVEASFISSVPVELVAKNGVVIFPAGTPLNFDADGDGVPDSIRTVVSYAYKVSGIPGDDSTQGSGKVTVWFQRMLIQTDQFEANVRYPVNANLFVSESGLFTTRQVTPYHPSIALVTGPPSITNPSLELLWL